MTAIWQLILEAVRIRTRDGRQKYDEGFDTFLHEFNAERPHEALNTTCPADTLSARSYDCPPEQFHPFQDLRVDARGKPRA